MMKKRLLTAIIALGLIGCATTTDSSDSVTSSVEEVSTVKIGLDRRAYNYAEVFDADGKLYRMHHVGISFVDTAWIDVPDSDTCTIVAHKVDGSADERYNIFRVPVIADSVYRLSF